MDTSTMNKKELLGMCKELGITKCGSKNKSQLIHLINSKTLPDTSGVLTTPEDQLATITDQQSTAYCKKIQRWWRFNSKRVITKFKSVIDLLKCNPTIMQQCLFQLYKISILYDPKKNENKFIYGKLIEKTLIYAMKHIGFYVEDLDKNHLIGAEYKNDIKLLQINISIKGKLNAKGDIILLNKKSKSVHNVKMEVLLCCIRTHKLYFIPSSLVDSNIYVKEDAGCISYKSKLITMFNKTHQDCIYQFPDLSELEKNELAKLEPLDIMSILFNGTIL